MIATAKLGSLLFLSCLSTLALAQETSTSSEINQHIDLSTTDNILDNAEFSITCIQCSAVGDFSLSGGTEDSLPDSNFTNLPFDFTDDWVGVVIEDFKVHIELDFVLTPTNPTNEFTIPLLGQTGLSFPENIGSIFEINWTFDPVLHGWVNSSTPTNFSYGFEFEIPPNSAVWIPVFHLDNITSVGFSQSTITPLNYTSSDPSDDFTFELSFRPIFKVSDEVMDLQIGLDAEVFADVPKLDITVSQVTNVSKNCEAAPSGTASDQVFHNLTHVVPTLSYDFGFNATDITTEVFQLGDTTSLPTSCLDFLPSVSALGPVPDLSNDGQRLGSQLAMVWVALTFIVVELL